MASVELSLAVQHLKKGNIIACPTETIWGLSCIASNEQSVNRIFEIKNRPHHKSLIVLVSNIKMVQQYAKDLTSLEKKHLKNDSPTTVVLDKIHNLPNSLLAEDQTLAFRIVKHPLISELIKKLGEPIVSTSANLSGESSARKFEELSPVILDRVDYTLNLPSSFTPTFKPSKIVKIIGEKVKIIRS